MNRLIFNRIANDIVDIINTYLELNWLDYVFFLQFEQFQIAYMFEHSTLLRCNKLNFFFYINETAANR